MPTQQEKYAMSIAGEHFVAAELIRRGASASVTLGNAKQADVVVTNADHTNAVVVEVKSAPRLQWIVGGRVPMAGNQPWVFVHVPPNGEPPEYFIFTAEELNALLAPGDKAYRENYEKKHGRTFSGRGVVKIEGQAGQQHAGAVQSARDNWDKILAQVS